MKSLVVDTVKEAKEKPNPAPSVQVPDAVYDKFDNLLNFNDETDWKIIKNKNGVRFEENSSIIFFFFIHSFLFLMEIEFGHMRSWERKTQHWLEDTSQ